MHGLIRQMAVPVQGALVVAGGGAGTLAQSAMAQGAGHAHHETGDRGKAGALVKAVRESTGRCKDVAAAEAQVVGVGSGAWGLVAAITSTPLGTAEAVAASGWRAVWWSPPTGTPSTPRRRRSWDSSCT